MFNRTESHEVIDYWIFLLEESVKKIPQGRIKEEILTKISFAKMDCDWENFLKLQAEVLTCYETHRKRLLNIIEYEISLIEKDENLIASIKQICLDNLQSLSRHLKEYYEFKKEISGDIVANWYQQLTTKPIKFAELPELADYKRYKYIGSARKIFPEHYFQMIDVTIKEENKKILTKHSDTTKQHNHFYDIQSILHVYDAQLDKLLFDLKSKREKLICFLHTEINHPRFVNNYQESAKKVACFKRILANMLEFENDELLTHESPLEEIVQFQNRINHFEQSIREAASYRRNWDVFFPFFETTSSRKFRKQIENNNKEQSGCWWH